MICITPTGSGKSITFILPAIMLSFYEQTWKPLRKGGPFVMIIVPSRELAIQIHETINTIVKYLLRENYPLIRSILCIGGVDIKYQIEDIQKGVHIMIGTPGRLSDLLDKRKFDTEICKYLVLDEADRLLDMGFDEEIKKLLGKLKSTRQKLVFSSSMPKKIQQFIKTCLFKPITINIGNPSIPNYNVIQDIEYIKDDSKLLYILSTLQKTSPPVIIFCENKNDVDEVTEYLALKGIDVCSLHGDKDQEERNIAIKEFKEGLRDVLVATDIVSKGLDFPNIEHVINYDMPKEVYLFKS
jgi:ATP-dependent RNA helicase DDX41